MTIVDEGSLDLLIVLDVAGRPVLVEEVAAALGITEMAALEIAERLTAAGRAEEREGGLVPGEPVVASAARRALLAGRWADALAARKAPPAEVGLAHAAAGRHRQAAELLVPAAQEPGATLDVVDQAIESASRAGTLDHATEASLLLARAAHLRNRGRSQEAMEDLERAVARAEGRRLVEVLGFVAATADDLQRPQRAETYTALAAMEAAEAGELAMLGSLLTLHGRALSRIGFPLEAEAVLERGSELVAEHGTERQRYHARMNRAWVHLDQGDARRAEPEFARLRTEARDLDPVSLGNQEAYWARASFIAGDPAQAVEAAGRAAAIATEEGATAPRFLAQLATVEGAWLYGRHLEGLAASESLLELILAEMPAWENVARYWRAANLAALDRGEDAEAEIAAAIAACPPGVDGMRWRSRCAALQLAETPEGVDWPQEEAEELTDSLLQARWYDVAALLMAERARREDDEELGVQATALALKLGNPMLAALCVERAGLWSGPAGTAAARAVRPVGERLPEGWREEWDDFPPVRHALDVDLSPDVVYTDEIAERIDEALAAAGLAGDDLIYSPAQRRARGLVRRRPVRRRAAGALAVVIGVAALSAVTAFAVVSMGREEPPVIPTTAAPTTTTTILAMEETPLELPPDLAGQAPYRGGPSRDGVTTGGVAEAEGRYWVASPGGFFGTDPVAYGNLIYLGSSTEDSLLALWNQDGSVLFEVPTRDRVLSAPVVFQLGETTYLVFGSNDGTVYARDAIRTSLSTLWEVEVGGAVRGAPLYADDMVIVATDEGRVVALNPVDGGAEVWSYQGTEGAPLGPVETSLAYADGIVYAADGEARLHLIDVATGTAVCEPFEAFGPIAGNPVISDGVVYLGTSVGTLHLLPAGSCGGAPAGKVPQIGTSVAFALPPAVADGVVYALEEQRLLAFNTEDGQLSVWPIPYDAGSRIATPPVVTEDSVYIGTQSGEVIAVDRSTGEERWRFETGSPIDGAVAVIPGAVFATTEDGRVFAIGGS